MGVSSPSTTRQPPVAIALDKAATVEAGTTLRSLTTSLQHTSTVPVAFYSFKSRGMFALGHVLIDQRKMDLRAMEKARISKRDPGEAICRKFGTGRLHDIDRAVLERDGTASLKKKSPEAKRFADSPF